MTHYPYKKAIDGLATGRERMAEWPSR